MKRTIYLTLSFLLLTIQCANLQTRSEDRYQNLYYQVAAGNRERVRQLIKHGYDINSPEDTFERLTPLMIASKEGHTEIVLLLVSMNVDLNGKTRNGHTALMMAAYNRYPRIVKILLDAGANPNLVTNEGHTALSEILLSEKEEIVRLLVEKGAK
ncbi:ankyrin repeat domain-containing protein [Leptospira bandrabouensis]|uniref:ankyrin repeat domain-containing protein n=1 Tax=Leptospira bandrabouensis TaxID=2484903 RepID=UPI00223DDCE0|nr:ankyrin repeat domain-containing protein [Leptospira bandrabouensis]MCW7457885.1 ankyrin repeat domain-containing protein [Leptospira bandrabouensis]MCW7477375.1 ankyrin repeat domain-containing protein [Leptospira bandrabouensis]MCW7485057.1 ankyrin repeat domain-containing protein [Leptospira bandrabouensis]